MPRMKSRREIQMSEGSTSDYNHRTTASVRSSNRGEISTIAGVTGLEEEEVIRRLLNIGLNRLDFDDRSAYALCAVKRGGDSRED